jgi:hypothetical protein
VTEDKTSTVVFSAANGMFKSSVEVTQTDGPCTARVVKYIAKRAAKNINSLESQTMVPTATKFGRVVLWAGIIALDMVGIIPEISAGGSTTSPF